MSQTLPPPLRALPWTRTSAACSPVLVAILIVVLVVVVVALVRPSAARPLLLPLLLPLLPPLLPPLRCDRGRLRVPVLLLEPPRPREYGRSCLGSAEVRQEADSAGGGRSAPIQRRSTQRHLVHTRRGHGRSGS